MNQIETFFDGMSQKDIDDYKEAEEQIETERINQYSKDVQVIRSLKSKLPKKLFHFIAIALHESENWTKLEIVNKTTGKYQQKKINLFLSEYLFDLEIVRKDTIMRIMEK